MVGKKDTFRTYSEIVYFFEKRDVAYAPLAARHADENVFDEYGGDEEDRRAFETERLYIVRRHLRQLHRRLIRACLADRFADIHPDLSLDARAATAVERALARSRIGDVRGHTAPSVHLDNDEEGAAGGPAAWITGEYMWALFSTPKAKRVSVQTAESVCRVIVLHVLRLLKWKHKPGDTTGPTLAYDYFRRACRTHTEASAVAARLAALVDPDLIVSFLIQIYGEALSRLLGRDWEKNLRVCAELERF